MLMYEDCHFGEKRHLACYHFSDFQVIAHLHRSYEFFYVETGEAEVQRDGQRFRVKAGEAMLILPYEVHAYESCGPSRCHVAVFSPDYLHEFSGLAMKMSLECPVIFLEPALLASMWPAVFEPEPNLYMTKAFLYSVVGKLTERSALFSRDERRTDLLHAILFYVQEHFLEEISLGSMAAHLGYSRLYLSRYLNQALKLSFTSLVNQHRISYGAYLLKHTEDSISTVALSCGYTNIRSFNRSFKAIEGVTPRAYREM